MPAVACPSAAGGRGLLLVIPTVSNSCGKPIYDSEHANALCVVHGAGCPARRQPPAMCHESRVMSALCGVGPAAAAAATEVGVLGSERGMLHLALPRAASTLCHT